MKKKEEVVARKGGGVYAIREYDKAAMAIGGTESDCTDAPNHCCEGSHTPTLSFSCLISLGLGFRMSFFSLHEQSIAVFSYTEQHVV
jgi:hypothetical protein